LTTQHANTKDVCVLDAKVDAKIVKPGMDSKKSEKMANFTKAAASGEKSP